VRNRTITFGLLVLALSGFVVAVYPESGNKRAPSVVNYEFTITMPQSGRTIHASAVLTVVRSSANPHLSLDLEDLVVDSIHVGGRRTNFEAQNAKINLQVGSSRGSRPDTILVALWYGGEVRDGLIIHTDRQGRWFAFGDNWPDRARRWLPTIDRPDAKATVSWNIITPADREVIANGRLLGKSPYPPDAKDPKTSRTLTRWRTERPLPPYLMVVGVGPLTKTDLGMTASGLSEFSPGVPQSVYAVSELSEYLPGPFTKAAEIVEFFSELVGPFPYEKLAHVQSFTRFGGMENAGAIFYSDEAFRKKSISTGLIAHETAHQWFGDAVTPASWGHVWLSEGFATYFEVLYTEKSQGREALDASMKYLRDAVLRAQVTYERPVIDTTESNPMKLLNSNSYQKGAWTLHMLRSMLGDSVFFRGIREYYMKFRHLAATTDDLCMVLEKVSKKNLRWYFDQWLRRPGAIEAAIEWRFDVPTKTLMLEVVQESETGPFRFPLEIEIVSSAGARTLVQVEIAAQKAVSVPVPAKLVEKPAKVVLDPHNSLLARLKEK
jgi:aminopeptidase N